jgi:hypothetical protein
MTTVTSSSATHQFCKDCVHFVAHQGVTDEFKFALATCENTTKYNIISGAKESIYCTVVRYNKAPTCPDFKPLPLDLSLDAPYKLETPNE